MSFSAIRMGAYEPIKYKLGGVDNAHTPMIIKVQAGIIAGKPNQSWIWIMITTLLNIICYGHVWYCRDIVMLSWYCDVVVLLWCCRDIVMLSWYCRDIVILWWYCNIVVILLCCRDIVVVLWYCCDILMLLWYCHDIVVIL